MSVQIITDVWNQYQSKFTPVALRIGMFYFTSFSGRKAKEGCEQALLSFGWSINYFSFFVKMFVYTREYREITCWLLSRSFSIYAIWVSWILQS